MVSIPNLTAAYDLADKDHEQFPNTLPEEGVRNVYGEMEEAIVAQLKPIEAIGIKVLTMPGKLADLNQPFPRGAVLVHYSRSEFAHERSLGRVVQTETAIFSITIGVLNLRTHQGIYQLLRAIRLMVLGFKPIHATRGAYLKAQKFTRIDVKNRLWEYTIELAVPTLAIARDTTTDPLRLLKLHILDNEADLFMEIPRPEA